MNRIIKSNLMNDIFNRSGSLSNVSFVDKTDLVCNFINSKFKLILKTSSRRFILTSSYKFTNLSIRLNKIDETQSNLTRDVSIGSDSFNDVVKSSAFVDKTDLIRDVINSKDKVILTTAPRRFGKTTNLDMLRLFLQINTDENGNPITKKNKTPNYKLFYKLLVKKDPRNKEIIKKHFGSYPVIYISFKDISSNHYDEFVKLIQKEFNRLFCQFEYLKNSKSIKHYEAQMFNQHILQPETLTDYDIIDSLKLLSELLFNYFKKPVYVLIDEYDAPLNFAIRNKVNDISKINLLINRILKKVLKSNKCLEKGFLTGISSFVKASADFGLNNISHLMFLQNHEFSTYYGFTKEEVYKLYDKFQISDNVRKQADEWYDGYLINLSNNKIYNNWSVICFLKRKKIDSYWTKTDSIEYIKNLFQIKYIQSKLELLLNEISVDFDLHDGLSYSEVERLQELCNYKDDVIPKGYFNLFFSFLFETGYLTYTPDRGLFKLPNLEIKNVLKEKMICYYFDTYRINKDNFDSAVSALNKIFENEKTNLNDFKTALYQVFKPLALENIRESEAIQSNEDLFHSILNFICIQSNCKSFGSEVWNSNKKRADNVLTNMKLDVGYVIEIKYNDLLSKVLEQAIGFEEFFKKKKNINRVKYIAINVKPDKNVDIDSKLKENILI